PQRLLVLGDCFFGSAKPVERIAEVVVGCDVAGLDRKRLLMMRNCFFSSSKHLQRMPQTVVCFGEIWIDRERSLESPGSLRRTTDADQCYRKMMVRFRRTAVDPDGPAEQMLRVGMSALLQLNETETMNGRKMAA